jgi:NADH-quinone oxidoreductase subunit M
MIAYSSVGHMGFVLLGFATLTTVGVNGALFANVAHGLITGLLFFLAGAIKERYGTADMRALGGGMLATLPHLGSVLTFAAIASLGVPGLAGFWGEMLSLFGAFQPGDGLPRGLFLTFMVIGGLGAVLTAAYFLVMLSRVTHGLPERAVPAAVARSGALGSGALGSGSPGSGAAGSGSSGEGSPGSSGSVGASDEAGGLSDGYHRVGDTSEWPDERPVVVAGPIDGGVGRRVLRDIQGYEWAAWVPLIVLILLFGLWPKLLLSLTTPAVQTLLGALS